MFRIGKCYQFLGSAAASRSAFEMYLQLFPGGKFATQSRQQLASLPSTSPNDSVPPPISVASQPEGLDSRPRDLEFGKPLIPDGGSFPSAGDSTETYPTHMLTASADTPLDLTPKVVGGMNQIVAETPPTLGAPRGATIPDPAGLGETKKNSGLHSVASEKAIVAALHWLKSHQESDGSWKCGQSAPVGAALATLAFLGHGETPDSQEFGQTVTKGLLYLAQHIDTNGLVILASGRITSGTAIRRVRAVLALAKGCAVTHSPGTTRTARSRPASHLPPTSHTQKPPAGWRKLGVINHSQTTRMSRSPVGWFSP